MNTTFYYLSNWHADERIFKYHKGMNFCGNKFSRFLKNCNIKIFEEFLFLYYMVHVLIRGPFGSNGLYGTKSLINAHPESGGRWWLF